MHSTIGEEIKRNFDTFIAGANRIRDLILDQQVTDAGPTHLKLLGDTIECAETIMRKLLMVAYFTANYRSCITRTDNPKLDHRVLDNDSPQGIEFGAKLYEKKRKAEAEAAKPKPCHIGLLDGGDRDTEPPRVPAAAVSTPQNKKSKHGTPHESLQSFSEDLVERYRALHGVYTNRFNLTGLTPTRPDATRILKRNDLLEEINAFMDTFGLPRVDKNDSIWREWFLKDFIGLDSPSRPITVQDTPDRKGAVYNETLSRIAEIAKKALK